MVMAIWPKKPLVRLGTAKPMVCVLRMRRLWAAHCGVKACLRTTSMMRSRVASLMSGWLWMARETVLME